MGFGFGFAFGFGFELQLEKNQFDSISQSKRAGEKYQPSIQAQSILLYSYVHIYVYGYVNRCKRLQRLKTAIYRRHNNLHFVTVSEKSNWATETGRCDEDRVHGIGLTSTQHTPRHVLEWLASPPPSHHPATTPSSPDLSVPLSPRPSVSGLRFHSFS